MTTSKNIIEGRRWGRFLMATTRDFNKRLNLSPLEKSLLTLSGGFTQRGKGESM